MDRGCRGGCQGSVKGDQVGKGEVLYNNEPHVYGKAEGLLRHRHSVWWSSWGTKESTKIAANLNINMSLLRTFRYYIFPANVPLQLEDFPFFQHRLSLIQTKMDSWVPQSIRQLSIRGYHDPVNYYTFITALFFGILGVVGVAAGIVQAVGTFTQSGGGGSGWDQHCRGSSWDTNHQNREIPRRKIWKFWHILRANVQRCPSLFLSFIPFFFFPLYCQRWTSNWTWLKNRIHGSDEVSHQLNPLRRSKNTYHQHVAAPWMDPYAKPRSRIPPTDKGDQTVKARHHEIRLHIGPIEALLQLDWPVAGLANRRTLQKVHRKTKTK